MDVKRVIGFLVELHWAHDGIKRSIEGHMEKVVADRLHELMTDLKVGLLFATRIPIPHDAPIAGPEVARSAWALPVAGILVGLASALVYLIAWRWALPGIVAAGLALAASMAMTGCLHEDGLADTLDGLGGRDRERKLEIMRDSRIGTYGACALILSVLLRAGALASLSAPGRVALALLAAHAGARAVLPAFMRVVPPARPDGLAADAGRPPGGAAATAAAIGLAVAIVTIGFGKALVALLLLLAAMAFMRWLCRQQVGGQTGDVVGALEQIGEVIVLLVAAAG
jgi:adenosylcobinamide-GDP ribazoletransferase